MTLTPWQAQCSKFGCWLINLCVAVSLYISIRDGHHEHESCCIADPCLACLEGAITCDFPCDFPETGGEEGFYRPSALNEVTNPIQYDDAEGMCSYSFALKSGERTWDLSDGCSAHCLNFDTREHIYESENVEEDLTDLLMIAMIMSIVSIIPCFGSLANVIADIVLVSQYFGDSDFYIVETDECNIMYTFETGILFLAFVEMALDLFELFFDATSIFQGALISDLTG